MASGLNVMKPSRSGGWALVLLAVSAGSAFGVEQAVRFVPAKKGQPLVVEVTGLASADLERIRRLGPSELAAILTVRVDGAQSPMLGAYVVANDAIRFESRFPVSLGLRYRAEFSGGAKPIAATIAVPKPPVVATTELIRVYPTRDRLPENQLKFYLHFSAPMSRGDAYAHVRLLDEKGNDVKTPFLELGEELWDPDAKRFTLFLHPGRIKRGLLLREELGPILEEGKRYTLVVDAKWSDAEGNPLKAGFRKSFLAGKPDDAQPDPRAWTLAEPAAGKTDALRVGFPEPLDHALVHRMLWIEDAMGKRIAGVVRVTNEETCWNFTPNTPWQPGRYRLTIDPALEDLAGNSITRPFEVDTIQPLPKADRAKTTLREFDVK